MPKYSYTARDEQGKKRKGEVYADSESQLYEMLRANNQFLLSCTDAEKNRKHYRRMRTMQLSDFCRQLGTLCRRFPGPCAAHHGE